MSLLVMATRFWNISSSSSSFPRSAKFLAFFWVKNSLCRSKSDFSGQKISRFCQNISMPYDNGEYNKIQRLAYLKFWTCPWWYSYLEQNVPKTSRQALSWCNKLNMAQSMTRSNNWIYGFQCPDPEHPIPS